MRRSALWALAGAAAVAGVGALAVVVARGIEGDSPPTTTTTTATSSSAATTTTEAPPRVRLSLVDESHEGAVVRHGPVSIEAEDLATITGAEPPARGEGAVGVRFDPRFVAAQEDRGVLLDRLRRQVEHVADRMAAAVADPDLPDVAPAGPPVDAATHLDVPVLVFNLAERPRRIRHVDVALVNGDGQPVTMATRFLDGAGIEVAAGGAWFTLLVFETPQIDASTPRTAPASLDGEVAWVDE